MRMKGPKSPGDSHKPRGAAAGRVIELPEAESVLRQPVEIRRGNLAAVAADVGKSQIVGQNQDNIRPFAPSPRSPIIPLDDSIIGRVAKRAKHATCNDKRGSKAKGFHVGLL
jgi:hypothetical protein